MHYACVPPLPDVGLRYVRVARPQSNIQALCDPQQVIKLNFRPETEVPEKFSLFKLDCNKSSYLCADIIKKSYAYTRPKHGPAGKYLNIA